MDLVINGRFLTQPVTGVQRVGIEFVRALDRLIGAGEFTGLQAEVVVPKSGTMVTNPALQYITVRRVGAFRGHLWEQLSLPFIVGGRVALHLGNVAPVLSLLLAAERTHVMVHDLSYKYFPEAYNWRFRVLYRMLVPLVLQRAATVITVSASERTAILQTESNSVRPDRLFVASNGVSRYDAGIPVPGREARCRRVLYVGSLTERKNAVGVIRAAITLVKEYNATVTIVGETASGFKAANIVVPAELSGRIRFAGQVNNAAQLATHYRDAAVFLFPSFYEASPLPPMEAMSYGCPVVASAIPSLRERCGDAAEYCDPKDVKSIVSSVAHLLDAPARWHELAQRGLERSSTFTWETQVHEVLGLILK